jgi:acyl transferase domain-containing protein/NAD(P)-dependent dehydrogenase (short-subunit alcohol dehydrogenase family)
MTSRSGIPLAIIGMGCKLPGADNLEEFWQLVLEGRTAIVELPPDRLDQEMYYDPEVGIVGKTYSKLGGIVKSRQFDRTRCPIPESLAKSVDNAHLLMCEVAADALRHAGMDPFHLALRNVGVYIGHAQGSGLGGDYTYATCAQEAAEMLREVPEFAQLPADEQERIIAELIERIRGPLPRRTPDAPDVACSLVAGTISKAFGLSGPFLALNSACASSLQAMLVGARALQLGHVDMAIVGGASDCKSDSLVLFAHARAMSSTGSRPFDAEADGLIVGEGYAALVMKTLERALADGDPIHAVVRGLGVSSDGKGKSLWAPRKEGQILAMQRAYRDGLDLGELDYVEAHATATQLGDATELNTLADVLRDKLPPGKKVPITSVKANIGHTLETAGIAGVIKTVLALRNGTIPPAASVSQLNPKIDWQNVPVYVPLKPQPWPPHADGRPRRAGVNAFGIGGLNMHVIVEEFNESSRRLVSPRQVASPASEAEAETVAIIGMGCVWPGARGTEKYWDLLMSGRDPKCEVPPERWRAELAYEPGSRRPYRSSTKIGGFITDFEYDWKTHKIPPKQVAQADPLQFMLLDAADQAMKQAGYDTRPLDRSRVGVIVGTEFGGDFAFQLQMGLRLPEMERHIGQILSGRGLAADRIARIQQGFSKTLLQHWPALIDETGSFSTSSLASRISKTWNMMGGAAAIDCGHCSALAALAMSVDMLLAHDCDMMLCAAGQRRLGLPEYEALSINGVLVDEGSPTSPLDASATGYVPAEGVGVLLLKRLSDARRDGDKILGIVRGVGAAHDPNASAALRRAIERALATGGIAASEIGWMEVDGTLTVEARDEQLQVLADLHAQGRKQPLIVSSVVGQIGHAEAAAGMASLIKAALEAQHGRIPKPLGLRQPRTVDGKALAVPVSDVSLADDVRLAAICSRSRGLTYYAIVELGTPTSKPVKKPQDAPVARSMAAEQPAPSRPLVAATSTGAAWRVFRFAGGSAEELLAELKQTRQRTDEVVRASRQAFAASDRFRAAIVADSAETLAARLDAVLNHGWAPGAQGALRQQGAYLLEKPARRPKIVFCFPGQGSQYPGMLRSLVDESPEAAAALGEIEAILDRYGYPSFADLAWGESRSLGTAVWPTQLSMLAANWLMTAAVKALGIVPDAALGHSYGEYSALVATGAFDFETALQLTRARCDGIAGARVQGRLLAVSASADRLEQLVRETGAKVYIANHNAPDQTVVGGVPEELEQFGQTLHKAKIAARPLAVPAPFHTPLMASASAPVERALAAATIQLPSIPLYSVVTNQLVGSVEEIRRNLVEHLTRPVLYVDLIRSVCQSPPIVLLEVGPQQVLTNLHRRIVEKDQVYLAACDQPKRSAGEQLAQVRALLEALGFFDRFMAEPAAVPHEVQAPAQRHALLVFDATIRRRQRMREAALSQKRPTAQPSAAPATSQGNGSASRGPTRAGTSSVAAPRTQTARSVGEGKVDSEASSRGSNGVATSAAARNVATTAAGAASRSRGSSDVDLERFLINFVVEQTGYPPEVVELDADLEADLGIDSIKKAQLFGELQEYFDVVPTEDLTLDSFPTLRHVLDFLRNVPMKGAPVTMAPPAATVGSVHRVAQDVLEGNNSSQATAVATAPIAPPSSDELERFLINFVVEQTGYPPEVVELDADLEADLGIDSIKKAQLFGELQEYFDVVPTEDLTLDSFPTLRHVLDFLRNVPMKGAPVTMAPPAATVGSVHRVAQDVLEGNNSSQATAVATAPIAPPSSDELERFLINFVVEQTGYPPEVVELDADLEADLGIDSIKKAQLFGELQEYFDVVPTEDLTLDSFPTLRHVLDFLRNVPMKGAPVTTSEPASAMPPAANEILAETNGHLVDEPFAQAVELAPAAKEAESRPLAVSVLEVSGTPYEMGLRHGEHFKTRIRRLLRHYADLLDPVLETAASHDPRRLLSNEELDELQGIADGAEVPLGNMLALNRALYADLGGASLQIATREVEDQRVIHAGVWTLPLLSALRLLAEPIILVRRPVFGLPHVVVGLTGAVGGLAGMNASGLMASAAPRALGQQSISPAFWPRLVIRLMERASETDEARNLIGSESDGCGVLISKVQPAGIWHGQWNGAALGEHAANDALLVAELGQQPGPPLQNCHHKLLEIVRAAEQGRFPRSDDVRAALAQDPPADNAATIGVLIDPGRGQVWLDRPGAANSPGGLQCFSIDDWRLGPPTSSGGKSPPPEKQPAPQCRAARTERGPVIPEPDDTAAAGPMDTLRFVLRTIPAPFPTDAPTVPNWHGSSLVVGDNVLAECLAERIAAAGGTVRRIRRLTGDEGDGRTVKEMWDQDGVPHLFLTSSWDALPEDLADPSVFERRFAEQALAPFYLLQAWATEAVDRKQLDRSTIVAVTNLGGDFGFAGDNRAPEGGALAGLIKAACLEFYVMRNHKGLRAKAIDAPRSEPPEQFAANILRELAWGQIDYEVAFRGGQRFLQNATRRRIHESAAEDHPRGTWVVTGGARGITAQCALELGRRFGLRLHLIGSSPLPNVPEAWRGLDEQGMRALKSQVMLEAQKAGQRPAEAWESVAKAIEIDANMARFRDAGIDFTYHACDVCDRQSLANLLDRIRRQGPITGLLHGAGIERSGRFERKSRALVEATFRIKVLGAYHLMSLTRDDPIRHFVGFGSISGRLGSNGQADYCAASDMLAKLAGWYRTQRPDCRAVTFHWHPWDEIGMAARPETKATFKMTDGPTLMPKADGLRYLINELLADAEDSEVLVTSREYFERYYGPGSATRPPIEAPDLPSEAAREPIVPKEETPAPTIARRFVLTLREAPLATGGAPIRLEGSACIIGDNQDAQRLKEALIAAGVEVTLIETSGSEEAFLAALDSAWRTSVPRHLLLLTARDTAAMILDDAASVGQRKRQGIVLPYLAVQRWMKRLAKSAEATEANLVAVTNLGGDFGIAATDYAPESGALAGLVKSIHIEARRREGSPVRCKVLDFAMTDAPEWVAQRVLSELAGRARDVEVAWPGGQRHVVELAPVQAPGRAAEFERGTTWVVTGGARGITAAAALHLGKRFGLKLHLVGVSPVPDPSAPWLNAGEAELKAIKQDILRRAVAEGRSPEEDWMRVKRGREIAETLAKYRAAGVDTTYHACDVSDWEAVDRLLREIRAADGPITGVIHGAGWSKSARIEMKSRAHLERTLGPKFDGTLALMTLTREDPLRYFITFGSISGRYGGNGLSDYAAANEAMAKLAPWHRRRRPRCATTCIEWQTWDEIGMATLAETTPINRNAYQMQFIAPAEGIAHFERELLAGLPSAEVVITDGYFETAFFGREPADQGTTMTRPSGPTDAPPAKRLAPLIESISSGGSEGKIVAKLRFDPATDPFLVHHRLKNAPFLPGVIAIEALAEAAQLTAPRQRVVAIRNVEIVQGIKFQDRPQLAQVAVAGTGSIRSAKLTVEVRNRRGVIVDPARPCAHGEVELASETAALSLPGPGQPALGLVPFAYADGALLYHGPPFRTLQQVNYEYEGGWGRIVAPALAELAGPRGDDGWLLPAAVLDGCVVACGSFVFIQFAGRLEVPYRIGQLRLGRMPREGEACLLRFHFRGRQDRHSTFDFTLFGDDGGVVLDVKGYTTVLAAEKAI